MPISPYFADTPPSPGVPSSTGALADLSAQTGIPLTGGSTATQHFPYVYLGTHGTPTRAVNPTDPTAGKVGGYVSEAHPTVASIQAQFTKSGKDNIHHWAFLLALAGYAGAMSTDQAVEFAKQAPLADIYKLHLDFLYDAADQYGHGRRVTPNQWLKEQLQYRLGDSWNGDIKSLTPDSIKSLTGEDSQAGTHSSTSKSVDFMSPEDAKGLVRGMLQQQLGRDPTQAEYEDFLATIHAAERANPSVSKTTYTTDAEGRTTNSSTTTSGGLGESGYQQLAYEKAKSLPSWAIWQAVGTYAPALFQALDAPISGV